MLSDFWQVYGLTETTGLGTTMDPKDHAPEKGKLRSCGKPYPRVEVKVVDQDNNELAVGEVGEIIIKGKCIMKGYWNKPEETNKVMTSDGSALGMEYVGQLRNSTGVMAIDGSGVSSGSGEYLALTNATGKMTLTAKNAAGSGAVDMYLQGQAGGDVFIVGQSGEALIQGEDDADLSVSGGDASGNRCWSNFGCFHRQSQRKIRSIRRYPLLCAD